MPNENTMLALPAPESNGSVPVVPEYVTFKQSYGNGNAQPESEEPIVPLSHYLWILRRHKWRIMAFVLVCVVSTVVVASRLTPIYEATATIDIDREAPAGFIGTEANRMPSNDSDQFLATQVKTITSDSVLRPVAERFKLLATGRSPLPASRVQNAPVSLASLKVTRPMNTYLLLISYRSRNPELAADVANGVADSYIQHTYDIRFRATAGLSAFMEKQIDELKAKMERSSGAQAQFEKDLSVINPEEKTSILSARLLQLNAEFTSAQGDRVRKQAAFDSVKTGSLEAAQASTQGAQLRTLADRLDDAREKFAVVKTQYGAGHPEYKKSLSQVTELERQFESLRTDITQRVGIEYQEAANRENMLNKAVAEIKGEFDHLNARFFEYKSLKREADADKGLYDELVRKIKEAGINSSFQNSSIRLSDSARPPLMPVFPNVWLDGMLALLFSTLLGVGAAVIADVLDNTVRDPEQIQRGLKTVVLGSLPVVKSWRGKFLPVRTNSNATGALVHSDRLSGQAAAFEEAIRTLRDSILLSDLGRRPRSLLMTSATPREGKTTTSVHLAIAHSLQNRKTLLIDADLRRPGVHGRLGLQNVKGMSTVVSGENEWHDTIQKLEAYPDLDIITAGPASRRAADRLGGVLDKLLALAEKEYDLVIVDGPPLLGFAEPLQMATVVDGVVVITMAGQTNRNAVASVLNSLRRIKTNVIGVVLNEVRADMSDRYYYYGYYGKYYSKYYKPLKS
jgi:succinoglycan biosynthesis transport protein ExoP